MSGNINQINGNSAFINSQRLAQTPIEPPPEPPAAPQTPVDGTLRSNDLQQQSASSRAQLIDKFEKAQFQRDESLNTLADAFHRVGANGVSFASNQLLNSGGGESASAVLELLKPGTRLHTGDILSIASQLDHLYRGGTTTPDGRQPLGADGQMRFKNTMLLLASGKAQDAQAVAFDVEQSADGKLSLKPAESLKIKFPFNEADPGKTLKPDFVVAGGEIESIVTAMHAARAGKKVVLLYDAGKLGNLNSDTGANLAYFDGVRNLKGDARSHVKPPQELTELFSNALKMSRGKGDGETDDIVAIPNDNLNQKLSRFLSQTPPYKNNITLVETNLNAVRVASPSAGRNMLVTPEGRRIETAHVIDTDPSSRILEKFVGANFINRVKYDTANLAYGAVFNVKGASPELLARISNPDVTDPNRILSLATNQRLKSRADIEALPADDKLKVGLLKAYEAAGKAAEAERADIAKKQPPTKNPNGKAPYGFRGLGSGYALYAKAVQHEGTRHLFGFSTGDLASLNDMRIVEGFNVAVNRHAAGGADDVATFNSISYKLNKRFNQGDHDLQNAQQQKQNPEFRLINGLERSLFGQYLHTIAGDVASNAQVSFPRELYVRQQTINIPTLDARSYQSGLMKEADAVRAGIPEPQRFRYHYDARGTNDAITGLQKRNDWDTATGRTFDFANKSGGVPLYLAASGKFTHTKFPGVFAVNKNAQSQDTFPVARIQQFSAMQGVNLVDDVIHNR